VCFVLGVGCCLCLRDASTDLRPYTRPFVSLVFLVHALDHPVADLHAFFLELVTGRVSTVQFGLRLIRRFDCKATSAWQDLLRDA